MKKSFSTWCGSLLAAFACMGFGAAAFGAAPYVTGWGMDSDGQASPTEPAVVCGGASAIAAGCYHSLAVVDSCVYAWGANGDEGRCNVPSAGRTNVVEVAAGREFSVALRNDGGLVAWGISSVAGKLVGDIASNVAQVSAGEEHVLVLKKDGKVMATGVNSYAAECTVPDEALSDVVQVAAGARFSFALKSDHTIVAWGNTAEDSGGVLNVPESLQGHAMKIAAGHYHALAITDTGDVVEWGWSEGDAIPDGARTGATDIAAGYDFSMVRTSNGKVYVWGNGDCGQKDLPSSLAAGVAKIAAGYGHCLALGEGMAPFWMGDSVPGEAYVARDYSGNVSVTGMPEVVYGKANEWPAWLKIDSQTGVLSGKPTATSRVEHVSIMASNIYGMVSKTFDIQVFDTPVDPPEFITKGIPDAEVGLYYSFRIQAANSPLFQAIDTDSYPLPPGLELAEDGTLSGTPTAEYDSIFYVMASNITAAVTTNYLMHVGAPSAAPAILTGALPDAMLGEPWSVQIETDREATFAIVSGTCPSGLDIEPATGVISGTPAESGAFAFTVEAANSFGASTSNFNLAVNALPAITTEALSGGTIGTAYSQTLAATGWPVPTFVLASGTLPGGLALGEDGAITGKPTASGTFTFGVTAANSVGTDTKNFSITIDSVQRPQFTAMTFIASNKTVKLEWTTPVTTNTYLYWSTNISATPPTWKSLGRKKSGVTVVQTNSTPIYYRLRIP